MKTRSNAILVTTFLIAGAVLAIATASASDRHMAEVQAKAMMILNTLGSLVALFAAVVLLFRAARGESFGALLPLTLPLLAGLLIAGGHWSVALALGTVAVAFYVRVMVGSPTDRRGG